jgi:hypothetical protein
LGLDDIGYVDQLVVPGIETGNFTRIIDHHIRDNAGLHRRDDFLSLRRERRDLVDLVALAFS